MIVYILKSATCLALLMAFYHLFLEREKMHNFNRFYLLGSVLFSFLIPLFIIYIDAEPIVINNTATIVQTQVTEQITPTYIPEETINYTNILIGLYVLISCIFLIRFGKNLFHIIQKIIKNKTLTYKKAVLVLVDDKILPHTFWNYIFINKKEYENDGIEQELFTHELTHVHQKHTIDVLLIEFTQCIFWINPFFILLKKAVQLNHEFLADENVVHQHKNTQQYQYLLLNKAAWKNDYYLASNLNYSLTKKRLKMMTTKSSPTKILLKKLAIIPLLTGFVFLFAQRVEAQEKQEIIEEIVEQPTSVQKNVSETAIYRDYSYRNLVIIRKDKDGKKISKKYHELTEEEKKRLAPPPPLELKKIIPTKKQFEALKDGEKVAVWIDGKVVKNEVLNNYKHTDFARYSNSFVYKNARSKRFPQEYQASLQTHNYFKSLNKKNKNDYLEYLKKEYNIVEIIETQENIKFYKDWFITIDGEKYFYTFDKNERVARYYKNNKLVDLDIIKEYNKKHKTFESLKNTGKHYVFKSDEDKAPIDKEFSDLGGMYYRMPRADKNKVPYPENPIKPYLALRKNNKVFYKLRKDLTEEDKMLIPPPPPMPNASKEEILKAKKAYEAWKKRTGNNFAPKPPKNGTKQEPKIAFKKANTNDSLSFTKALHKLLKSEKDTSSGKEIYYLDGKKMTKKEFYKKLKPEETKNIDIRKERNGTEIISATTKKG